MSAVTGARGADKYQQMREMLQASMPRSMGEEIARGIAAVEGARLPDGKEVLAVLRKARDQWSKLEAEWETRGELAANSELAIVVGAVNATHHDLPGPDRSGFSRCDELGVRWVATVRNHVFRSALPFWVRLYVTRAGRPTGRPCSFTARPPAACTSP